ncbi:MAG: hypothetical protein QX189_10970 [Methylococcales bacterium]
MRTIAEIKENMDQIFDIFENDKGGLLLEELADAYDKQQYPKNEYVRDLGEFKFE